MVSVRAWFALALAAAAALGHAAPAPVAPVSVAAEVAALEAADLQVAVVWVDGRPLFKIAGLASTMPAAQRASRLSGVLKSTGVTIVMRLLTHPACRAV